MVVDGGSSAATEERRTTAIDERRTTAIDERASATDEQIAAIFAECDTSGDGFIDLSELRVAMAKAGKPVSEMRATELLELVDANGDGQISLTEFESVFDRNAPDQLQSLAGTLEVTFLDEVRAEVARTQGQLNGPILSTVGLAAFLGVFWKSILEIPDLYDIGGDDPSWLLPQSLELLATVPSNFLDDYSRAVELAPLLTMACTSCFAYAVGDLVAQRVEGRWRAELLDLGRCARNAALGFGLHGPLVYGWIQLLEGPLAQLVGGEGGGGDGGGDAQWSFLLLKIALDQTLFSALINILYATLNGVLSDLRPTEAFARARTLLVPAMVSSWRFWPAVQLISYSPLVPVDYKLLWIDTMEILWVAYLSATVNGADEEQPVAVAEAQEEEAAASRGVMSSGDGAARSSSSPRVPWGEGWLAAERAPVVLEEPGDSDLLYVGPLALGGTLTGLAALSWPTLVVGLMTA